MKKFITDTTPREIAAIILLGAFLFGLIKYVDYRLDQVMAEVENANSALSLAEKKLDNKIKDLGEVLLSTLSKEQQKNTALVSKFDEINDSVEELEKLSATDKELLQKYSKVYFLNEHYVPISLSDIDENERSKTSTNFQIHSDVLPFLEDMIKAANNDDLDLRVQSAFRSFGTQSSLKASYTITYGAGTANKFSADQGYSEHQLGTAVDFTTGATNGALLGFDKTPEYKWLLENAYNYGFILSYPAGNTYYKFEPWHWRFVGVSLARKLHDDNMNFYDMDQRIIDTYLSKIFD